MRPRAKSLIAIVDDHERVRDSLANLLESEGYDVLVFPSVDAFLAELDLNEIDCVVSDIAMSGLDGFDLQRTLGVARPDLPVILITALDARVGAAAAAPNHFGVLRKPFNSKDLLTAVSAAINGVR